MISNTTSGEERGAYHLNSSYNLCFAQTHTQWENLLESDRIWLKAHHPLWDRNPNTKNFI